MGGDAQKGPLQVMFDGKRVNNTYDPMRKQGAILLGNGGDNGNASQGTFYEGAMTAAGTFPTDATDQLIQSNVVAAKYDVPRLSVSSNSVTAPPGVQTFSPGSSQNVTVTFTNTTARPVAGLQLSVSVPSQWTSAVAGEKGESKTFSDAVAPGAIVSASFKITSGPTPFNGDLIGHAQWTSGGEKRSETAVQKVRNVSPVKINEFRISAGPPTNATDSFIELYNADSKSVDIANWTLTEHPTQQAIFSTIKIPTGTKLSAGGFYLLGLSNSGLAVAAREGDSTIYVRSITGMSIGDTVTIGTGADVETHKITRIGTAASSSTTLWQPLPDGPVIKIPLGLTNVPVTSTAGFVVGEKIALGYGATFPAVAKSTEHYEVATVTSVGKPGTQAYLAADAHPGETNLKVTSVANISVGDKLRLDIDSTGHGIETVTVMRVGTQASRTNLSANAAAGATNIKVRNITGFAVGDKLTIGLPPTQQTVTLTAVGTQGATGTGLDYTPALDRARINSELVVVPGTGIDLDSPLKFSHASNLPFANRGTGITFQPATAFAHSSDEPVQALGTGITLDRPLTKEHPINDVVRDAAVTTAGYQGTPVPNQWFGGPEFTSNVDFFGRNVSMREGTMVLRDANGVVVDSLNYGGLVDPWAAEGYQGKSGSEESGCFVAAPGPSTGRFSANVTASNTSSGRFPDGADTDSNCTDFLTEPSTALSLPSVPGENNIKVASVAGFNVGQTIRIDSDANLETGVVATVGTAGGTTVGSAVGAGAITIPVASAAGFSSGQTITIDSGANSETAVIASILRFGNTAITISAPLTHEHAAGAQVSGTGITLKTGLTRKHPSDSPVAGNASTPGAANHYQRSAH